MTVHTPIPSRMRGLPAWATWLTVLLLLVGGVYLVSNLSGTNPTVARGPQTSAAPSGSGAVNASVALALIKTAGCQACHGQNFEGGIGPDLHGIAAGPVTADLKPVADANPDTWIHLWIAGKDPAVASIDRKGMPAFGDQLSDSEIDTIVAYLKTLQ